jgi:hypothetical protein
LASSPASPSWSRRHPSTARFTDPALAWAEPACAGSRVPG